MGTLSTYLGTIILLFSTIAAFGQIKITSGYEGEIYNQFAIDIKNNTDVPIAIYTSQGSIENLSNLLNNGFQLGFLQYDVLLFNELENPEIKNKIKVMLPLYVEEIHLVTRKDGNIKSLSDLKGKRVGTGSEMSGTNITATFIQYKTMIKWTPISLPFDKSISSLVNDSIDAFFYVGAAPSNLLKSLSANVQQLIKLVPIENKNLKDFYKKSTIKKKTYPWLNEDIQTISVMSLIAVNTLNINDSTSIIIESLYEDLKGNLQGIQKNKLSHIKWDDVDFTDTDDIDWPIYRDKYISIDFVSLLIAYLAALLSLMQIYFIINKLWKRKHEKMVADSISISAMFISILINLSFAFKNLQDGGIPQFSANIMWIGASSLSAAIGMGIWVASNRNAGFFNLLIKALNMERKEAADLAKVFFRPSSAEKIIEILGRMAMVDEDLDQREKDFIQSFADHWNIEVDWSDIQKYASESGDRYERIKTAMSDYLKTSPQEEQVNQLRDVFNLLVKIDEVVTSEEQMIIDELEGQIAEYLKKDNTLQIYRVAVVPQSQEQDDAVGKLLQNLKKEKIAGGYAYLSPCYYSERYAEMISSQYRAIHVFSVVVKPKQLTDDDFMKSILSSKQNTEK
jgi:TRAP transporter TAXI family solute receptor